MLFLNRPLMLLSPDTNPTAGLNSATATSGGESSGAGGSGSDAPNAKSPGSPEGKAKDAAPPASKQETAPGTSSDKTSGPPRKSIQQKLAEIHERNRQREKEQAVAEAKESGKKEAIAEAKNAAKKEEKIEAKKEEKIEAKKEEKKYEPNYKYRLKDNKELEFDEFIRPAITDEETEKRVRDLYSRAAGLDFHKTRTQDLEQYVTSLSPLLQKLQEANDSYNQGDLDGVFASLNIPQEKVLQWLVGKAQYQELDPDQRRVYDERQRAVQEARQASKQAQDLRTQQIQNDSATKLREFELVTKIPAYEEYAKTFDAFRKEGAFRSAVADRGELAYMRGKNISVEDAIKEVMELYGPTPTNAAKPHAESKGTFDKSSSKESRTEPPVIPNIGGRSESAVSQTPKYRSTKELRKRLSELSAQERSG